MEIQTINGKQCLLSEKTEIFFSSDNRIALVLEINGFSIASIISIVEAKEMSKIILEQEEGKNKNVC